MPHYRIYLINDFNSISAAHDFEGPDDSSALYQADQLRGSRVAEVWQQNRLVARLEKNAGTAQAAEYPRRNSGGVWLTG
jgi:hypothetical protein